jgi:hypothetical protein
MVAAQKDTPKETSAGNRSGGIFIAQEASALYADISVNTSSVAILDSGATMNFTGCLTDLYNASALARPISVRIGNGDLLQATHGGACTFSWPTESGGSEMITLREVYFVPGLQYRLLSATYLTDRGAAISLGSSYGTISTSEFSLRLDRVGPYYGLTNFQPIGGENNQGALLGDSTTAGLMELSGEEAHLRFGHSSATAINAMVRMQFFTLSSTAINCKDCQVCLLTKQTRAHIAPIATPSGEDVVQVDLAGPLPIAINGDRYFAVFIHCDTGATVVYGLKAKSDVLNCLSNYLTVILPTSALSLTVTTIQTDGGSELTSAAWVSMCASAGLRCRHSPPDTQAKNGHAERKIGTLKNMARAMLHQCRAPVELWPHAIQYSAFLQNRLPFKGRLPVSFLLPVGSAVDLTSIRPFGTKAVVLLRKSARDGAMGAVAWSGTFVGYATDSQAALIFRSSTRRVLEAHHYSIVDNVSGVDDRLFEPSSSPPPFINSVGDGDGSAGADTVGDGSAGADTFGVEDWSDDEEGEDPLDRSETLTHALIEPEMEPALMDAVEEAVVEPMERPPRRATALAQRQQMRHLMEERVLVGETLSEERDPLIPSSYKSAMQGDDKRNWKEAVRVELASLVEKNVFVAKQQGMVPRDCKVLRCHWVFALKKDANGRVLSYKARLVAGGNAQIDVFAVSSPVAEMPHLRSVVAIAALRGWKLTQADFKTAYLNAPLNPDEDPIYMWAPPGWSEDTGEIWQLLRSLYGLKQSGRNWYKLLRKELTRLGFSVAFYDGYIFFLKRGSSIIILVLYVDDLLLTGNDQPAIDELLELLNTKFELKRLDATHLLGMRITETESGISLDQKRYVQTVLDRFGMTDCRGVTTPSVPRVKPLELSPLTCEDYLAAVGCISYLSNTTRLDTSYTASRLGANMIAPTAADWIDVKRVFRYLKAHPGYSLNYSKDGSTQLACWADSDYAGDSTTRRSQGGFVITLGGAAIAWSSTKQTVTALSSSEAESLALAAAARAIVPLRRLCADLGMKQHGPTPIYEDNRAALLLAMEGAGLRKAKHMDVRYHYVWELIEDGIITVESVSTGRQAADALTKPVNCAILRRCSEVYFGSLVQR